jgi:DNA-directed RNA polymerase omega subunit
LTTQHALLDTAIKKVGNRYLTTMLLAKRIRQLHHGARSLVQRQEGESHFSIAIREIAEGLIVLNPNADLPIASSNGTAQPTAEPSDETPQEE